MNGPSLRCGFVVTAMTWACLSSPACAEDQVAELLKFAPHKTNSVSVIRVKELLETKRSAAEDWVANREARFLAGSALIPPWAQLLVRATEVEPRGTAKLWSVSLAPRPADITLDKLAAERDRPRDDIAGQPVLRTRTGFLAQIGDNIMTHYSPADRQDFSRFLKSCQGNVQSSLPPYLLEATNNPQAQVIFAVDLEDFFEPGFVLQHLAATKVLAKQEATQKSLTELVKKIRGMQLAITVDTDIHAELRLDFSVPVQPQAVALREAIGDLLDDCGAHVEELTHSKATVSGNSVTFTAPLSEPSLRQLMTLILSPVSTQENEAPKPYSATGNIAEVSDSLKYYQMVILTLTDLEKQNRKANDYNKTATWHDNYAKKIASSSVVGVDPEVAEFGAQAANGLRTLSASLRGVPVQINKLENKVEYRVNVNSWWGQGVWSVDGYHPAPWEVNSNLQEVRARQAEAIADGATQREQIWQNLADYRTRVRNDMSIKYKIDFDSPSKK